MTLFYISLFGGTHATAKGIRIDDNNHVIVNGGVDYRGKVWDDNSIIDDTMIEYIQIKYYDDNGKPYPE